MEKILELCKKHNLTPVAHIPEKEWLLVIRHVPIYVKKERKANPFFPQTKYEEIAPGRLFILLYGEKKWLKTVSREYYIHIDDLKKYGDKFSDE